MSAHFPSASLYNIILEEGEVVIGQKTRSTAQKSLGRDDSGFSIECIASGSDQPSGADGVSTFKLGHNQHFSADIDQSVPSFLKAPGHLLN